MMNLEPTYNLIMDQLSVAFLEEFKLLSVVLGILVVTKMSCQKEIEKHQSLHRRA